MHNMDELRAGMFKVAGRVIVTSVVNGCPGFPHLPSVMYSYLISPPGEIEKVLSETTKDDVVDWNVLEVIQNVLSTVYVGG